MTESHLTIEDARELRILARSWAVEAFNHGVQFGSSEMVEPVEAARKADFDAARALTDELSRLTGEPIT